MFGGGPINIEAIVFKESKTQISGIRAEYRIDGDRIQFHLWPDPEFPEEFEAKARRGLKHFNKEDVVVDYVPEVASWYVEVKNINVGLTDSLVESIVKKLAKSVDQDG